MARPKKEPLFVVRACATGIWWNCPYCGHLNRTKLPPRAIKLQCKFNGCRRKFLYGIKLYEIPPGTKVGVPQDFVVPDQPALEALYRRTLTDLFEPLPVAEFSDRPFRKGEPLHELIPAAESDWEENSAETAENQSRREPG